MIREKAIETLKIEAAAIENLIPRIDDEFIAAVEKIMNCSGRVVVTGMGKSGHVGRKIAATLASTGTPSFFMHPAEAYHGDLGMLTEKDVLIAISNSGESSEIVNILPVESGERIQTMIHTREIQGKENTFLTMVTRNGKVKRLPAETLKSLRNNGLRVILLEEGDRLIAVRETDGNQKLQQMQT